MASVAYPFERWERMSRAEARRSSVLARALAGLDPAVLADLKGVLGVVPALQVVGRRIGEADAIAPALGESVGLVVVVGAHRAVLAIAPGVARAIADRAVGGPGTDVALGPTALSRGEAGLVGYVVARALGSARSPFTSLLDAGKARDLVGAWKHERTVAVSAELSIGETRGLAMLIVPIAALEGLSTPARAIDRTIPVRASMIVGDARLSVRDVRGLAPGDVIVPDALTLDPRSADVGRARLVIGRASRTFDLELREGAWRVVSSAGSPAVRPPVRWKPRKDRPMSQPETDTLQSLSDVEVELSIELARLELPIAEVAALAPGVVVTTGRLVGERVAVRAGDRVIAWGELVDVEGEVGVRLTEVSARGERD